MQVSFTGFKNASTICFRDTENPDHSMYVLSAEITNDYDGADLSNYKKAIQKSSQADLGNKVNKNFANFALVCQNLKDVRLNNSAIYLNGKFVDVNDTNLGIFTFLADMSKKLARKSSNDYTLDKDYLQSEDFDNIAVPGNNLNEMLGPIYSKVVPHMVSPDEIKRNSNIMNEKLEDIMIDYFA